MLNRQLAATREALDFSRVKLVLTDCDGCLTDAGMYYSEQGDELKKFNTRDGMAFKLLREHGVKTGIVTGENSQSALRRAQKLKADHIVIDCKDKLPEVERICAEEGIGLDQVAYVGDDVNDVAVLRTVGLPCCPADAQPEARAAARYHSAVKGGSGVIRDIAERIIASLEG